MSHSVGFWLEYVLEHHRELPIFLPLARCFPVLPVHSESQPKETVVLELSSWWGLVSGSNLKVHSFTPKAVVMFCHLLIVAWCFDVYSCAMADVAVHSL